MTTVLRRQSRAERLSDPWRWYVRMTLGLLLVGVLRGWCSAPVGTEHEQRTGDRSHDMTREWRGTNTVDDGGPHMHCPLGDFPERDDPPPPWD